MRRSYCLRRARHATVLVLVLVLIPLFVSPRAFASEPHVPRTGAYHMFVTNLGNQVIRADLDGMNGAALAAVSGSSVLGNPEDIALDIEGGKMYITSPTGSSTGNRIVRANLDGSAPVNLTMGGILAAPTGVALDLASGQMYITNFNNRIVRSNLEGTVYSNLGDLGGNLAMSRGIALDLGPNLLYLPLTVK